jgi:hypothetical protein
MAEYNNRANEIGEGQKKKNESKFRINRPAWIFSWYICIASARPNGDPVWRSDRVCPALNCAGLFHAYSSFGEILGFAPKLSYICGGSF